MDEPRGRGELLSALRDHDVQLLLGRLLTSRSRVLHPIFDGERGYRYPEVEDLVNDPSDVEGLLQRLVEKGLLERRLCGSLLLCPRCGSSRLSRAEGGAEAWLCSNCGSTIPLDQVGYREVYSYALSPEALEEISSHLFLPSILDFLRKRGFKTESPGYLEGESGVVHRYDVTAFRSSVEEGVLVLDLEISEGVVGAERILSMFAKVYDTTPLKAVLVAVPALTEEGRRLAAQYRISVVEGGDPDVIVRKLLRVVPPADKVRYQALDAMTLLSLPDHLRSTAMALHRLGEATAEEVARATGRARAVESGYLNQLVRMGYVKKRRRGRRVLFSPMT